MKILGIWIKGLDQFQDIHLDFTHPDTGDVLDKICFIGRNGTGKSKLLNLINHFLHGKTYPNQLKLEKIAFKVKVDNEIIFVFNQLGLNSTFILNRIHYKLISGSIELDERDWFNKFDNSNFQEYEKYIILESKSQFYKEKLQLRLNPNSLLVYSPSESAKNSFFSISNMPQMTLDESLQLFNKFQYYNEISNDNVKDFWKYLIYLIKKRDNENFEFENKQENLSKTKHQLIEEFEKSNPKILDGIALLWDRILALSGLEFDVQGAKIPIQLTDNLEAYIRLKATKVKIPYNQLSTGIRNFIFRIGHLYALYFNRKIENGFVLIDEPENSLFPDFIFELMEIYSEIIFKDDNKNTQFFVATHNPIVAAQFEPHERIILEWNDDATVSAYKGKAPVGDDPNDVLVKDFGLTHLMGKKGQEMWDEYLELRKKLKNGVKDKDALLAKINKIGNDYNFES